MDDDSEDELPIMRLVDSATRVTDIVVGVGDHEDVFVKWIGAQASGSWMTMLCDPMASLSPPEESRAGTVIPFTRIAVFGSNDELAER